MKQLIQLQIDRDLLKAFKDLYPHCTRSQAIRNIIYQAVTENKSNKT